MSRFCASGDPSATIVSEVDGRAVDPASESAPVSLEDDDSLESWTRRLADVCTHCGLRALDGDGRCQRCGGGKQRSATENA